MKTTTQQGILIGHSTSANIACSSSAAHFGTEGSNDGFGSGDPARIRQYERRIDLVYKYDIIPLNPFVILNPSSVRFTGTNVRPTILGSD